MVNPGLTCPGLYIQYISTAFSSSPGLDVLWNMQPIPACCVTTLFTLLAAFSHEFSSFSGESHKKNPHYSWSGGGVNHVWNASLWKLNKAWAMTFNLGLQKEKGGIYFQWCCHWCFQFTVYTYTLFAHFCAVYWEQCRPKSNSLYVDMWQQWV